MHPYEMNRSAADLQLICNFPESRNSAILAALAVITAEDGMRSVRSVFTVFSYVFKRSETQFF